MRFCIKRPKKEVRLFSGNYNVRSTISDIITNNVKSKKTILIRVNSKKVIDETIGVFSNRLNDKKIACFYSDEKNVLYKNQEATIIDNLKKGVIRNFNSILSDGSSLSASIIIRDDKNGDKLEKIIYYSLDLIKVGFKTSNFRSKFVPS